MKPIEEDKIERTLQSYLDGELSPEEARAFERLLESDSTLAGRAKMMRQMTLWLDSTRAEPPPSIVEALGRRLREEDELSSILPDAAPNGEADLPWWRRLSLPNLSHRGWVAAPAGILIIALLLSRYLHDGPSDELLSSGRIPPIGDPVSTTQMVEHEFVIDAGNANEVCLVGGFNHWTICSTPFQRSEDGLWRVSFQLPSGRHEYMFVVDGDWQTDPNAKLHMDDGFGNRNAVLLL